MSYTYTAAYKRKREDQLKDVYSKITPICIVCDTSGSMRDHINEGYEKNKMDCLNEGIETFLESLREDSTLCDSAVVSIVTFGNDAQVLKNFTPLDEIGRVNIEVKGESGDTPRGVDLALELFDAEKEFLKEIKKRRNQPWLVIFSDGRATPGGEGTIINPTTGKKDTRDINQRMAKVQTEVKLREENGKLNVIPVYITNKNNNDAEAKSSRSLYRRALNEMGGFRNDNDVVELGKNMHEDANFKKFFKTLASSVMSNSSAVLFKNYGDKKGKPEEKIQRKVERVVIKPQKSLYETAPRVSKNNNLETVEIQLEMHRSLESNESLILFCTPKPYGDGKFYQFSYKEGKGPKNSQFITQFESYDTVTGMDITIKLEDTRTGNSRQLIKESYTVTHNKIFINVPFSKTISSQNEAENLDFDTSLTEEERQREIRASEFSDFHFDASEFEDHFDEVEETPIKQKPKQDDSNDFDFNDYSLYDTDVDEDDDEEAEFLDLLNKIQKGDI